MSGLATMLSLLLLGIILVHRWIVGVRAHMISTDFSFGFVDRITMLNLITLECWRNTSRDTRTFMLSFKIGRGLILSIAIGDVITFGDQTFSYSRMRGLTYLTFKFPGERALEFVIA